MPIQSNTGGGGGGVITETDPVYTADKPNIALKSELPTNTSDLTNDSNFVSDSDYNHTDNNLTDALVTKINNQSGINTGDQDLSGLATKTELQSVKNLAIAMAVAL